MKVKLNNTNTNTLCLANMVQCLCPNHIRIRTRVAITHALVILRGRQQRHTLAVGKGQAAHLLADQQLLNDDLVARCAKVARAHDAGQRILGLGQRLRQNYALTGGETRCLDDDRRRRVSQCAYICERGRVVGKSGERGGRNAVAVHEGLGEGLGCLEEGSHQRRKIQYSRILM